MAGWTQLGPDVTYIMLEQSPDLVTKQHNRLRPGLNHLAFHVVGQRLVDQLADEAAEYGWSLLFPAAHPHAGGPDHYAAYLNNTDGYEVELVASDDQAG